MSDVYRGGDYAKTNPDWHDGDAPQKARAIAAAMRYCGLRPRTVVDVGCGTGRVLAELKQIFDEELPDTAWEGWDIAKKPIRKARQREGQRLMFVGEDFFASERQADLLLCIDTLEHLAGDREFAEALLPRAKHFVFRVPLELSALDAVRPGRVLAARRAYHHRHFYTRPMAIDLIRSAGYQIDNAFYDRMAPPLRASRHGVFEAIRRVGFAVMPHRTVRWLGGWSLLIVASRAS